jgi:hypothetical protein
VGIVNKKDRILKMVRPKYRSRPTKESFSILDIALFSLAKAFSVLLSK